MSQTVSGQSAVSFSWDAAGNRTGRTQGASSSSFTWDAEGELVSSTAGSTSVSSVYDADGSRLVKFEGANVTVYLPGGMEVSSSSTTAVSATRWYSFAGKTVAHRTGNGLAGVTSVVTDHQGTVVGTIHNTDWGAGVSRKRPDPFGGSRSSSSVTSQGRGFLGAVHDANALVLLGARYLDPVTGSFVSVDPLLDPLRPAHFNAYSYGWNNPVTWDDPSGLAPTVQFDGGIAGKYRPKVGAATGARAGASGGASRPLPTPSPGPAAQPVAGAGTGWGWALTGEQWAGIGVAVLGVGLVVAGVACTLATAGICGAGIAFGGGFAVAGGGAAAAGTAGVSIGTVVGGAAVAGGAAGIATGAGVVFNDSGRNGSGPKPGGGYGRGGQRLKPDPDAGGYPHSTFRRGANGKIDHYVEWTPNSRNPGGYDAVKRFDLTGAPHYDKLTKGDVRPPHVQWPRGGVTPAEPWEIP